MKRVVVCFLVVMSFAAIAGEGHEYKKCTASADECTAKFKEWAAKTTYSGIWAEGLFSEEQVTVKEVAPESPAAEAGIKAGDVLVAINGVKLDGISEEAWKEHRASIKAGAKVWYKINRGGDYKKFAVVVTAMPMEIAAKKLGKHLMKSHGEMVATAHAGH
ncbi:MAG: PDZ domain-containing protein [Acidobacteriota bacterium]|nr:PDZ domain-containing protein [Acidobacteriota bacterium]